MASNNSSKEKNLPKGSSMEAQRDALPSTESTPIKIDPALAQKLSEFRQHLQVAFAKVVMSMMTTPRYKHCSLNELETLVLDPLMRNHISLAHAKPKDGATPSQDDAIIGIAIWAKVSPEVDTKIREQIKAKVFPIRLKAEDWTSGDIVWLLDVIAPDQKLATAVLANIRQVVKEGQLFAHPIVRGLVDSQLQNEVAETQRAEAAAPPPH